MVSGDMLRALREAVEQDPDSAEARLKLGTALCHAGHLSEAEAECRRAVELDPANAKAWVNLGGVLLLKWDFEGCVEANRKAAGCREDLKEAHYNRGIGHMYLGQAEEMVSCFERVIELDPRNAGAHYHLAVGLLALKQVEQARASLTTACRLGYHPQPEFLRELDKNERKDGPVAVMEIGPETKEDSANHN